MEKLSDAWVAALQKRLWTRNALLGLGTGCRRFRREKCTIQLARPGEGMHSVSTQSVSIAFHLTARASGVSLSYMYD